MNLFINISHRCLLDSYFIPNTYLCGFKSNTINYNLKSDLFLSHIINLQEEELI